ncbi:MAG: glutamate--tRNA ligase [Desulfovibrionaceae bacterium]|nr:glutamate--tRNA ligase [Desulfovibrionaceae bacterium]
MSIHDLRSLDEAEALFPPRSLPAGAEVLRIAPSPTGFPHIGTAMQTVLNRALADKTGGIFIVRIEDTDRARLVNGAEEAVMAALDWLGIPPDEGPNQPGDYGPYRQSERLPLYRLAAEHLTQLEKAYHCFCPPERLEKLRQEQMAAGHNPRYDRHCLALPQAEIRSRLAAGEKSVIRFRAPEDGPISFVDEVRGPISFDADRVDDPILLKADGYPTYHLAALVDDHFMRVTTVIRGEEWISSTPKHIALYRAFGWEIPRFLHTVILRDAQRRKLSKRSGDTSLRWFQAQGYLPEGFRNFLTRLLWPHPEEKDIYPLEDFVRLFNVRNLPRTGPVVDAQLLDFINGHYLARLNPEAMRLACADYLACLEKTPDAGPASSREVDIAAFRRELESNPGYARKVFALEPERNRKLADIFVNNGFFFEATLKSATREQLLKYAQTPDQGVRLLEAMRDLLAVSLPEQEAWETGMRGLAEAAGLKPKPVFMMARLALTGSEKTPPLYAIMEILELGRVRERLGLASQTLKQNFA